jgi:hypothetical protein
VNGGEPLWQAIRGLWLVLLTTLDDWERLRVEGTNFNDELKVRYLLGGLSTEERAGLEDAYFGNDELFEQLLAVEDELVDAYVRGELSADERESFESRFLTTPRLREKVGFARELMRSVARERVPEATRSAVHEKGKSWWHPLFATAFARRPVLGFSLAAILLVLLLGGVWLAVERGTRREGGVETEALRAARQREQDAARQRASSNPANENISPQTVNASTPEEAHATPDRPPGEEHASRLPSGNKEPAPPTQRSGPAVLSLALSPGLVRGNGEPVSSNHLGISHETKVVALRVSVEAEESYKSYSATVETIEGRNVWRRGALKARESVTGSKILTVFIPASALKTGGYILRVSGASGASAPEGVGVYYFSVNKN